MGNVTAKTSGDIASFMTPAETNIKSLKVHFSPKQLGEGDPSPENVREIVGWDGIEVNGCGKNLFQNANGKISPLKLKKGTIVTASSDDGGYFRGKKNGEWVTPIVWLNKTAKNGRKYTEPYTLPEDIDEGTIFLATGVSKAQITLDDNIDYKPYQGNTISYQWKIPDEYQEVEYIESTGTQYIELPFGFDRTDEIETRFAVLKGDASYVSDKYIVSPSRWNDNENRFAMGLHSSGGTNNNQYCVGFGQRSTVNTYLQPMTTSDFLMHTWEYKGGVFGINEIGLSLDVNGISFGGTTYPLKLFYGYNSNTMGKIAYYKHKKINGDLYNLIPCYRKSDNEIGMYDTVSQTFYTNQGTGTFLKGEDVDKTFYGGYVDLISGELVEEYGKYVFTGDENIQWHGWGDDFYIHDYVTDSNTSLPFKSTDNTYCNMSIPVKNRLIKMPSGNMSISGTNGIPSHTYIVCSSYGFGETLEDCKAKLSELYSNGTPYTVVSELKDIFKKTYQLTPTQLSSFIGQNNFWSNADYVEIEYELKETEDIQKARKKIILNQPHIESVKGDLVNFTTNMKAPLKECKVYFEPIQESEGDPSPDNVRNITGWDGIDIFKTSNIIIPNDVPSRTDKGITWTTNEDGSVHVEGTSTSATWYGKAGDPMHYIKGNVTYKLSGGAENVGLYLVGKNLDGTGWSEAKIGGVDLGKGKIFTLDQDAYVRWQAVVQKNRTVNETIYPKLTIIDTNNFEPYQGTTTSVSWSNEIGTVYGGYIDLVTGELVSDMAMVEFDGSSDENWQVETLSSGLTNYYMYATSLIPKAKGNQRADGYICSNMCIPRGENETYTSGMFYFSASGALNVYLGGKSNTSTVAEFKTWLTEHKLQIAYWLAEPIHYQLTPQQLLTLKGENNIWSDTNGQTEVKFWTH